MKNFKLLLCMALAILTLMSVTLPTAAYTENSVTLYSMYIDGKQVGVVRYPARALSIYDSVEERLRSEHQEEVFINSDVYFKEIKTTGGQITNEKALVQSIEEAIDVKINAYAINIDGTKVCYVKSIQDAEKVIDDIKAPYIKKIEEKENSQLEEVAIKEVVSFDQELVSQSRIINPQQASEIILNGTEGYKEYEVKEGDSLWAIAHANNVSVTDLEKANPNIENYIIQPGDIIKVGQQQKLLTVVTKERIQYSEEIPFETEIREDRNLEKGKTKVIQEGEKGEKQFVALVTREDGQETSRDIVEEKVVKEPVKRIEAKGTKVVQKPQPKPSSSNKPSSPPPAPSSRGKVTGSDIVNYAMKFLGYPYKWGTRGPNSFDCSGFTHYVYKQFGIHISSGSVAQRSVGRAVSKSELKPGDIVCFKNSNHVGIYIGNGNMIHASSPKTGVIISNINKGKYPQRYVTARRLLD